MDRSAEFLVLPCGSLGSDLACQLLNPTFFVPDPYLQVMDNPASPTIHLMHQCGFSSVNSLVFDCISRRDTSQNLLDFWTEEVRKPHEDFVKVLRDNMAAVIELCWGVEVWRVMERNYRLVRFPLWGRYDKAQLYLEMNDNKVKRLVIKLRHPQFFCHRPWVAKNWTVEQDRSLEVAAKIVGLTIPERFWECSHAAGHYPEGVYPRISRAQHQLARSLSRQAQKQLEEAFPEQGKRTKEKVEKKSSFESTFRAFWKTLWWKCKLLRRNVLERNPHKASILRRLIGL